MEPLLTIVVPVYNAEKYLNTILKCLINQTYRNKEIILVDDGSKDSSPVICNEYGTKYDFINVIHKENGGVHTARNAGLEVSKGEYIAFIDSDDWVNEDYCEQLMSAIEKNNCDFAACQFITEYSEKRIDTKKLNEEPNVTVFVDSGSCLKAIWNGTHSIGGFVWNKIFKRSVIADLRFRSDIPICDDLFFSYQFMHKCRRGSLVEAPLYHYRYVADGLSKHSPIERYINCLKGMKKLCIWVKDNAPECTSDAYENYIFWNTKSCEHMINNYNDGAFAEIQQNLTECQEYIDGCDMRIRFLAKMILKSWRNYRFWGLNIWRLKQLYIKVKQI